MFPRSTAAFVAALLTVALCDRPAEAGGRRHHQRNRVVVAASPQWQPTPRYVVAAPRRDTYPTVFGFRRPYPPPFEPGPGLYRGTAYRMPYWSPFTQMGSYGNTFGGNLISPNAGPFFYGW